MSHTSRGVVFRACAVMVLLAVPPGASAQGFDLTIFAGRAFPIYDERLTLRPSDPSLPGVDITVAESPILRADGGPVFGAAVAFELGIIGIEGRLTRRKSASSSQARGTICAAPSRRSRISLPASLRPKDGSMPTASRCSR